MKKPLNTSAPVTAGSPQGQRAIETFCAQYNKAGLSNKCAQMLNEDPDFAAYLLAGIQCYSTQVSDYSFARSILGVDFITPQGVMNAFPHIVYSRQQLAVLANSGPSRSVLQWCKDNDYVVIPAPPTAMSTLDIREIAHSYSPSNIDDWWVDHKFVRREKTSFGWLMVKKTHVSESTNKTWEEQNSLLSRIDTVPNVAEMSWFITTYYAVCGVPLFENIPVRTSSVDSEDYRIYIYCVTSGLFVLGVHRDNGRESCLGLSAARK